eukprot:IDg13268t1
MRLFSLPMQLRMIVRPRKCRLDVGLILYRSISLSGMLFNLNAYSDEMCLHDFHFRREEILVICKSARWSSGKTKLNGYEFHDITPTCILLRRLATPCRLKELEDEFDAAYIQRAWMQTANSRMIANESEKKYDKDMAAV